MDRVTLPGTQTTAMALTVAIPTEALTVVAPPPAMVSQRNVEAVVGVPAKAYLELLRRPGCPLVPVRVGGLRFVDREAFLAWLRALPAQPKPTTAVANDVAPPTEADDLADFAAATGMVVDRKPAPAQTRGRRK